MGILDGILRSSIFFKLGIDFCISVYYNFVYTKERRFIMSPRTGRPTTDPKTKQMPVRFSESDIQKLEYCSKVIGKSQAEIIRMGVDKVYNELKEKE